MNARQESAIVPSFPSGAMAKIDTTTIKFDGHLIEDISASLLFWQRIALAVSKDPDCMPSLLAGEGGKGQEFTRCRPTVRHGN